MQAVIDTNVLVSALLTPGGVPAQLIEAIRAHALVPVVSRSVLAEYAEVLNRPKFGFAKEHVDDLLEDMSGIALFLNPQPLSPMTLPDPDDAPFVAAALTARCPVVTGNSKHFPASAGVKILSPAQCLQCLHR